MRTLFGSNTEPWACDSDEDSNSPKTGPHEHVPSGEMHSIAVEEPNAPRPRVLAPNTDPPARLPVARAECSPVEVVVEADSSVLAPGEKATRPCKYPLPRKPLIGMNADYRSARKDAPAFSFLSAGYYDSLTKAGAVPVVIPPLRDEDDLGRVLDALDGVVLCGGADLDPRNDGFMLHPAVRPLDRRREDFDRMLVRMLTERRMPVFGIGCGMQLLNVSQGGTLFLHIPEDLPRALPHLDPSDANHRHALVVEPGTLMERVFGEGEIRVNSMHHMAIDEVAPGFMVTARCPDGVIEAIESATKEWFAIGTQFHPESDSASALDLRIFEEFVDAIATRLGQKRCVRHGCLNPVGYSGSRIQDNAAQWIGGKSIAVERPAETMAYQGSTDTTSVTVHGVADVSEAGAVDEHDWQEVNSADGYLEELLARARDQGYLTYDEVTENLPDEEFKPDKLDKLLMVLEEEGIDLLDESPVQEFIDVAQQAESQEMIEDRLHVSEVADRSADIPAPPAAEGKCSSDPIRMYLSQMAEIPLLKCKEERVLAKKIEITRKHLRRTVISCNLPLRSILAMLAKIQGGDLPFDRAVKVSLTSRLTKEQISSCMARNVKALTHLTQDNERDFKSLINKRTAPERRMELRRVLNRRRRKMVTLVEELSLRTGRLQGMMREIESTLTQMEQLAPSFSP